MTSNPRFIAIRDADFDPQREDIVLGFQAEDGNTYRFNLAREVVGLAVMAMIEQAAKLPPETRPPLPNLQPVQPAGLQMAVTDTGMKMLIIRLWQNIELKLVLDEGALEQLGKSSEKPMRH